MEAWPTDLSFEGKGNRAFRATETFDAIVRARESRARPDLLEMYWALISDQACPSRRKAVGAARYLLSSAGYAWTPALA